MYLTPSVASCWSSRTTASNIQREALIASNTISSSNISMPAPMSARRARRIPSPDPSPEARWSTSSPACIDPLASDIAGCRQRVPLAINLATVPHLEYDHHHTTVVDVVDHTIRTDPNAEGPGMARELTTTRRPRVRAKLLDDPQHADLLGPGELGQLFLGGARNLDAITCHSASTSSAPRSRAVSSPTGVE